MEHTNHGHKPRHTHRPLALAALTIVLLLAARLDARPAARPGWAGQERVVARVYYEDSRDIARLSDYDVWELSLIHI